MRVYLDCGIRNAAIAERLKAFGAHIAEHLFDAVEVLFIDAATGGTAFVPGSPKGALVVLFNAVGTAVRSNESISVASNLSDDDIADLYLLIVGTCFTPPPTFLDHIKRAVKSKQGAVYLSVLTPHVESFPVGDDVIPGIIKRLWADEFSFAPVPGGGNLMITPGYKPSVFQFADSLMYQIQVQIGRPLSVGFTASMPEHDVPAEKQLLQMSNAARTALLLSYLSGRYGRSARPFYCQNKVFS